jgi:D-glycero-D-manno-heptose 1,7-bisphosphate phosphatase
VERPEELHLLPGVGSAIRRLNDAGLRVFVVTNQRGVARGRLTVAQLELIHARLTDLIDREAGARIEEFFFCPHEVGTCDCRKPQPGMLLRAKERWPEIDLEASAMVGDSLIDVEAGNAVGMTTVWLGTDVPDLSSAVAHLLGDTGTQPMPSAPLDGKP